MRSFLLGTALVALAACERATALPPPDSVPGPRDTWSVTLDEATLFAVHTVGGAERLRVLAHTAESDAGRVDVEVTVAGERLGVRIVGTKLQDATRLPRGMLTDGEGRPVLIVDGAESSAAALAGTRLGQALLALSAYDEALTPSMPELRHVFRLAVFVAGAAGPPVVLAEDIAPPGMREGDAPRIGMVCDDAIKCPSRAPFCVKSSPDAARGTCTRLCAADADCRDGPVHARCVVPITDVPGVSGYRMGCAIPCESGATACPGLTTCSTSEGLCGADDRISGG